MSQKQIYKKKGEPDPVVEEEKKTPTDKGQGNFRGGRGRGGRGGKFQDRPHTQRDGQRYAKKGEVEGEENGQQERRHHGDRRGPRKEEDKDSYYYKYYYEQRPRPERVKVTMDTEIPAQIPKDQRKKEPSKKDFEK